jgi:hypothetical protein
MLYRLKTDHIQQISQFLQYPTFYVLPPLLLGFLEAESAVVAEPEVFALVFSAAELFPQPLVFAADLEVSELGVVFVSFVSVVHAAEPQASVDIAFAFDFSVPVSLFAVEVDSAERPKFPASPNVDHYASSSSSAEVVG